MYKLESSTEDTPGLATGLASRVAASSRGEQAEVSILGLVIECESFFPPTLLRGS